MKNCFKVFEYPDRDVLAVKTFSESQLYMIEFKTKVEHVGNDIFVQLSFNTETEMNKSFDKLTNDSVLTILFFLLP